MDGPAKTAAEQPDRVLTFYDKRTTLVNMRMTRLTLIISNNRTRADFLCFTGEQKVPVRRDPADAGEALVSKYLKLQSCR
jgi:hypothetical protein